MQNDSRNMYGILGNVKEKEIDTKRLNFQQKLISTDLNYSPKKPRIYRNSTTKEIKKKLLQKKKSISPKKEENSISRNKILEYKILSNRNKFPSISTKMPFNLTYQENLKIPNNNHTIGSYKEIGSAFQNQKKISKFKNFHKEVPMRVLLNEKKERKKNINKNEISALPKTKNSTQKIEFNQEIKNIKMKNKSMNKHVNFDNVDEKGKIQNKIPFHTKSNLSNFYLPNKKQKRQLSISANQYNEKYLKKSISLNILNNNSQYKNCYTERNKSPSISKKNSFKYNIKYNTFYNLKQKIPKKTKTFLREKLDLRKTEITNSFNKSLINVSSECNNKEKKNKELEDEINKLKKDLEDKDINIKMQELKIKELENFIEETKINNKNLEEEINKLKKNLEDKDKNIKIKELKIKELENIIEETKNNNKKELEKLMDEIKKIRSIIPFDIIPGEKIMSIIFKSDDQNILISMLCKNTHKFSRLKEIIFDKYPEYKEYENNFLFNGKKINENETLEKNKIEDGSIITLYNNC